MIKKYNKIVEEIVFEFVNKLYKEEGGTEKPTETDYTLMDYNGFNQGPVEIWDHYIDLDDILMCQANNFTANSLIDYTDLCLEAYENNKELGINYYNYAKYGIKGKVYSKEELEESKTKLQKAKEIFLQIINKDYGMK